MFTSSPEFAQALWNCPQMLGRVQVLITPDRYTLGEVELLTLLGTNAGRELDWDVFPETREARMIRNPKASVRGVRNCMPHTPATTLSGCWVRRCSAGRTGVRKRVSGLTTTSRRWMMRCTTRRRVCMWMRRQRMGGATGRMRRSWLSWRSSV